MLFQIKSYLKFLWHSKNEHAVHSPFVFNLITKCFYDKHSKPEYSILETYRNSLLRNTNTIEVTDFGAGSKVFKSNKRSVSKIAKTAGISSKRAELLFRIVHYFQSENILEIGTSLGLAAAALSLGNKKATITTLEGCNNTMAVAKVTLQKFCFTNVALITTEFGNFINAENLQSKIFDLLYFDGNHQKKATLEYFEQLLPTVTNDTVWILDDIHWSLQMQESWKIIQEHPLVTVTIDTFDWGFVFFRREQPKEHFIIRV
jgi:predicted O-methyltransferase YrrM